MLIIGLLGDVASGKSLVAGQLAELGAGLLDGDRAGHEVLRRDDVRTALTQRWGNQIVAGDGQIDRRAVAQIVFAPSADAHRELAFLESVTHPHIGQLLQRQIEALRAKGCIAAVLDAPVMLKAGWDRFCDVIVFVDTPAEVCQQRAAMRGWDAAELDRRRASQEPVEVKRRHASVVIDNSGSPAETSRQVTAFWRQNVANRGG